MVMDGQLAFDFEELAREDARNALPSWRGAPLHFTTGYYAPADLEAAFEHWRFLNGNFGSLQRSHMWNRAPASGNGIEFEEHAIAVFSADLSPGRGKEGPGDTIYQAVCDSCEWHQIGESENTVVEAWHDHAVPGWRDLPVIPAQIRVRTETGLTKLAKTWITEHYPSRFQVPGVPIITERSQHGTRHVPGYSPWGGYDLSSTALERPATEAPEPPGVPRDELARAAGADPRPESMSRGPDALRR